MAHADALTLMSTITRLATSSHISIAPSSFKILKLAYNVTDNLLYFLIKLDTEFSDMISREKVNALNGQAREAIRKLEDTLEPLISNHIMCLEKSSPTPIAPSSVETMSFVLQQMPSFSVVLENLHENFGDSRVEALNALDGQAGEAVRQLEALIANQIILSQSEDQEINLDETDDEGSSLILSEQVRQEIHPITGLVKEMGEYFEELKSNPLPEEEEEEYGDVVSSRIGGDKSKMVGFSKEFERIVSFVLTDAFLPEYASCGWLFVSLYGMAGIGKTTLAREVFEHPSILSQFDSCVWVTVGQKYTWKGIIRRILAQLDSGHDHKMLTKLGETELEGYLSESLKDKRYLVVLDDVWDNKICDCLRKCLPDDSNQSCVLVTTRLLTVAYYKFNFQNAIDFMDIEKSWDLLRWKVFGEERCPFQLEKAGKKIAENCEGLPLLIVQVAKFLSKAEKTPEYWEKVAQKQNSVFTDAHDQILDVLLPSYTHLPACYKPSFVYMGVFPHKYEIPLSKLLNLWCAEGFHLPFASQTSEVFALQCIERIFLRTLVVARLGIHGKKTCRLHSVFWHLCNIIARESKLFHVLSKGADSFVDGIESQRRLCIHNNVLFSIKDVYDSMASVSTVRSLLCSGPYHQYPVPVCFGLRLLRVLYALTIRFYEFPMEVLKLVLLRYLALTYDAEIPPSISNLWNLEYLIVHQHLSIKSSRDPSYLPTEIWDMKELKHLEITRRDLQDPCGSLLPNLLTLSGVSTWSCSKSILEGLPKLEKLRIRIELELDSAKPVSCFDHISLLHELETLKCVIVNPNLRPLHASITNFSSCLKRLTLSGFGYPWEDMRVIASLPNLEVIKLRSYAFRGPKWDMTEEGLLEIPTEENEECDRFLKLEFLLIEDTDLMQWRITSASFPSLMRLSIKHCYKLEQIPLEFAHLSSLQQIEIVDCSPSAVSWATQVEKIKEEQGNNFVLSLHSSWDDQ